MELHDGDWTLRDMNEADIEDDIHWFTTETRWRDWDAPWEKDDPFDGEDYRRTRLERMGKPKDENRTRYTFELDYKSRHIGGVSSYRIDAACNWAREGRRCVGIAICEPDYWNKGIGGQAFSMFINYLFSRGYTELYTQTWSGNVRMIHMARRLGFTLFHRDIDMRQVNGKAYDRVTYMLTAESWQLPASANG